MNMSTNEIWKCRYKNESLHHLRCLYNFFIVRAFSRRLCMRSEWVQNCFFTSSCSEWVGALRYRIFIFFSLILHHSKRTVYGTIISTTTMPFLPSITFFLPHTEHLVFLRLLETNLWLVGAHGPWVMAIYTECGEFLKDSFFTENMLKCWKLVIIFMEFLRILKSLNVPLFPHLHSHSIIIFAWWRSL